MYSLYIALRYKSFPPTNVAYKSKKGTFVQLILHYFKGFLSLVQDCFYPFARGINHFSYMRMIFMASMTIRDVASTGPLACGRLIWPPDHLHLDCTGPDWPPMFQA